MNNILSKLSRGKNQLYGKYIIPRIEREYLCRNDSEIIHYLFYKKKSPALIIGFQAYNIKGARYNYVTPLSSVNANRLYIKDDFVLPCGNYYLGRNNQFNIEKGVFDLIDQVVEETKASDLFFIGSSKGGYAALNFGLKYPNATIVIASPQYYLGSYMDETKKFTKGLEDIVSLPVTEDKLKKLDARLETRIKNDPYGKTQRVFIQSSVCENGYEKHVKFLLRDLEAAGITVSFEKQTFQNHSDLKYYFPEYLKKTLMDQVGKCQ